MEKTLLEHHSRLRIDILRDDVYSPVAVVKLRTVEAMAKELGWRYLCSADTIEVKTLALAMAA